MRLPVFEFQDVAAQALALLIAAQENALPIWKPYRPLPFDLVISQRS
jgi:hypothetical protein